MRIVERKERPRRGLNGLLMEEEFSHRHRHCRWPQWPASPALSADLCCCFSLSFKRLSIAAAAGAAAGACPEHRFLRRAWRKLCLFFSLHTIPSSAVLLLLLLLKTFDKKNKTKNWRNNLAYLTFLSACAAISLCWTLFPWTDSSSAITFRLSSLFIWQSVCSLTTFDFWLPAAAVGMQQRNTF